MIKGADPLSSSQFNKGLVTRSDILKGDIDASPNTMDVQWNYDSSLHKRFGCSSTNSVIIGSTAAAGWTIDSNGTLSTSISSYWKMDEPSSSRLDSVSTNHLQDSTVGANTTNSITGIRGNAALFVAANSNMLATPSVAGLQGGNSNFSMAGWIYLNSTSATATRTLLGKIDSPTGDYFTTLLLHMDESPFTDSGQSAKTVTNSGAVARSAVQSKFGGFSALFDGTTKYLQVANYSGFNFSGDFTVDCWIFTAVKTQDTQFRVVWANGDAAVSGGIEVYIDTN